MTQQVAQVLWLTEQTGWSWHSTLNFQEGEEYQCQGLEHPSGRGRKLPPLPTQPWQSRGIENQLQSQPAVARW